MVVKNQYDGKIDLFKLIFRFHFSETIYREYFLRKTGLCLSCHKDLKKKHLLMIVNTKKLL